jgi:hypothetical protein
MPPVANVFPPVFVKPPVVTSLTPPVPPVADVLPPSLLLLDETVPEQAVSAASELAMTNTPKDTTTQTWGTSPRMATR